MQRHLLIAASVLALTACSSMDGLVNHHSPYADLAKIAKQNDAQHALLLTRDGKLVVVNVATGELVQPTDRRKETADRIEKDSKHDEVAAQNTRVSDEEFEKIKRTFNSTITLEAVRGSVCMNIAKQPPGQQWTICSPPYPKWW